MCKHILREIYRNGYEDHPQDVVRWCIDCGAVVVDRDYDGRTAPGKIMQMIQPSSALKVNLQEPTKYNGKLDIQE